MCGCVCCLLRLLSVLMSDVWVVCDGWLRGCVGVGLYWFLVYWCIGLLLDWCCSMLVCLMC